MHACHDALLTVFKGHIVAAACIELGIEGPDMDLLTGALARCSNLHVADRVVKKFTVLPEAILGKSC